MVSREGGALMLDLVIKRPKLAVSHAEIRIMRRDWKILHDRLGDIVPEAIFVETEVQGSPNVVVVAGPRRCGSTSPIRPTRRMR